MLAGSLKAGTKVNWSVPWGSNPIINQASKTLLEGYIKTAMGR